MILITQRKIRGTLKSLEQNLHFWESEKLSCERIQKEIEEKERFVKDWVKWNGYELKKLDDKGEKSEWPSTKMRKTEAAIQEIQSWIEKFKKLG